ncbi:hypothetical protein [Archangium lansingense]|uniref:Transporter n=1 Tax=Archangium lansingense TaxID=2995310 RepID=A0ABT3ZX96_9BACT|nr:hypothetical protein [Archangium lansinium]MCY1074012.1 hypothetical protein [Archangium lansinium]
MRSPVLLAPVLAVFLSVPVHAGQPRMQDVEELFLADNAYPQEAFELQTTLGMSGEWRNTWEVMTLSLLTEWGLTDRLQIEVRAPLRWELGGVVAGPEEPSESGIEAGLLYALVHRPDLGLVLSPGLEVELPLSLSRSEAPGLAATPFVAVAQSLGPVRLHLNLALELRAGGARQDLELEPSATFAATLPLGTLVPLLELGLAWEDETRAWLSPGLVWRSTPWLELGLGLPTRLGPKGVAEVRPTLLLTCELELAVEEE